MPFPQFAVIAYFVGCIAIEIGAIILVFSGCIDIRGWRYRTRRDFLEATIFRIASKGTLITLLVAGGFWEGH